MQFVYGDGSVNASLLLENISDDVIHGDSATDVCSLVFTDTRKEVAAFQVRTAVLNVKYNKIQRKPKKVIDMVQRSVRYTTRRMSARFHVPTLRTRRTSYTGVLNVNFTL